MVLVLNALFLQYARKLLVDMVPFTHAHKRKKVLFAKFSHLILGPECLPRTMIIIPDIEQGYEIGIRIFKPDVLLIGLDGLFEGPFSGVLDAQRRGYHGNVMDAAFLPGRKDHAGNLGVNGHFGHYTAFIRKGHTPVLSNNGPQFHQEVKPVFYAPWIGSV